MVEITFNVQFAQIAPEKATSPSASGGAASRNRAPSGCQPRVLGVAHDICAGKTRSPTPGASFSGLRPRDADPEAERMCWIGRDLPRERHG